MSSLAIVIGVIITVPRTIKLHLIHTANYSLCSESTMSRCCSPRRHTVAPYCVALCITVLRCMTLHCIALCGVVHHCAKMHDTALCGFVHHCAKMHDTALHCTVLVHAVLKKFSALHSFLHWTFWLCNWTYPGVISIVASDKTLL